jgi:HD-GYP domain-containing protein (c-di-GMP phosphodiesterase class II)
MTVRARLLLVVCGLVPTLAVAVLSLYRPASFSSLETRVYDTIVRTSTPRPPSGRIVIVDVDERSLAAVGQWPWRRDLIGTLIDRLRALGASTIALDVMFAEPDRDASTVPAPDEALADSLRAGRAVLGYALTFDRAPAPSSSCLQHPLGLAIVRRGDHAPDDPFFRATGAVCGLPLLTQAAGASGFLNAAPDPDGILRRVPLLMEFNGRVYPAFALAAVAATKGTRDMAIRVANVNTSSLMLGDGVPLDGKSNLLLRYRGGRRTFPYVSAAAVLSGEAPAGTFADKMVFVGTTALGTREVVSTPLDTLFTGVEVQATVADNLLQQDFIRRPEYGVTVETQVVVALGLVAIILVGRLGVAWSAFFIVVSLAALWGGSAALLSSNGAFLSPLFPTLGVTTAVAAMTVAQSTLERVRADRAGREKTTAQRVMVHALLSLVEIRDFETGRHSRRTQQYTHVLASELASHPDFRDYLTPERIELLAALAPLHDIGKVGVPDRLLNKPGALTADELAEMRKHTAHGRDVILKTEREVGVRDDMTLSIAKDIVYTHHEKWDGTGYPEGLRGTDIPIAGRVMALVDVYDAVRTRRLYHAPQTHEEVEALIVKCSGTHFDPAIVEAFVKVSPMLRSLSESDDLRGMHEMRT